MNHIDWTGWSDHFVFNAGRAAACWLVHANYLKESAEEAQMRILKASAAQELLRRGCSREAHILGADQLGTVKTLDT